MQIHSQALLALVLVMGSLTSAQTTAPRTTTTTPRTTTTTRTPAPAPAPAAAASALGTCTRRVVRKEFRDLTAAERTVFLRGMRKAVTGNPSMLNKLASTHMRYNDVIHAGPNFLPWHRLFIRRLEGEIQKTEPTFALHYWDWTKDARAPERSPLLQTSTFGGNSRGACLRTSSLGTIYASVPNRHCLTRNYVGGATPGPMYPRAITDAIINQYSAYTDFAMALEGGPHASPHNNLGGDIGTMYSPEDPIFFLHHSMIDYLYHQWQARATSRLRAYSGANQDGSRAALSDQLLGLKGRVSDVLDIRRLCYSYRATGRPDSYGTTNDMEWAGNPAPAQQQEDNGGWVWDAQRGDWVQAASTGQQQQQDNGGWVWDAQRGDWVQAASTGQQQQQNNGGWVWDAQRGDWVQQRLVRRTYATTRPAPAAAAKAPAYVAPAAQNYTAPAADYGVPKVAPLRMFTDEEAECAAKDYDEPLVHPRPIDEAWLKGMGLCVATQRALEKSYCAVIDKINTKIVERCNAY